MVVIIGWNGFMLCCVAGKVQDGQRECGFKSTATSGDWNPGVATTVDGRHPLNHPRCMKPCGKKGDILNFSKSTG